MQNQSNREITFDTQVSENRFKVAYYTSMGYKKILNQTSGKHLHGFLKCLLYFSKYNINNFELEIESRPQQGPGLRTKILRTLDLKSTRTIPPQNFRVCRITENEHPWRNRLILDKIQKFVF